ncbi:FxsA family protein [Jeotgalibacillus proteolyticus]|uniref:Membrane protein FxsA n=1 Tax=Jeotgalibacillus proteolyticus TaxID=2082395 RepID=A0A2S5GF16_9BACL|nr:FxsA family protein [Jeotgalibacillus proteolyticus]PPA71620.1 membrane protein FxsA [Jeotgalibacillus proteolyticus]
MRWLMLLIIVIPAIEIAVLISIGNAIGVLPTFLLIIATGVFGAYLAKSQGLQAIRNVQNQMGVQKPAGEIVLDGVCILIGGVLLLTPGFISDIAGFLLLIPRTRNGFKPLIYNWFRKRAGKGNLIIYRQ